MSATIEELPTTPVPAGRPFVLRPSVREALWGYVFIGPWLIGLVLFIAGPMIASLVMSLTDFNLVHPETTKFIGIDNYVRMTNDPTIGQSLIATLKFALLAIPITMGASLGFALLLNHPKLPGQGSAAHARLHAVDDPARRLDARVDRASSTPRPAGSTRSSARWGCHSRTGSTARRGSTRRCR